MLIGTWWRTRFLKSVERNTYMNALRFDGYLKAGGFPVGQLGVMAL